MKSLLKSAAVISLLVLSPALALAQETGTTVNVDAEVQVKPRPLTVPPVKKIIQNAASSTRAEVKERVDAAQEFIDKRKAEVRALIERKPVLSSTTIAAREEKREEMREKLEEKKAAVADRLEAAREKAKEKFGEAVQTSVNNIIARLGNAVEHLTAIALRIDARIAEHEAAGADMSVSIGLLADSRTAIAAAQDKIAAVGTALQTALAAANPKAEMTKVRSAVKAAEDALKAAKESLHKTLESVRTEGAARAEASADVSTGTN